MVVETTCVEVELSGHDLDVIEAAALVMSTPIPAAGTREPYDGLPTFGSITAQLAVAAATLVLAAGPQALGL